MPKGQYLVAPAILDLPSLEALACGVVLQLQADLRASDQREDALRSLEDGSVTVWLDRLGLTPDAHERVAAHLRMLAEAPLTPAAHELPELLEPVPPLRLPGQATINPQAVAWIARRAQEGWSQRQIGAVLHLPQPTVSLLFHAGRQHDR